MSALEFGLLRGMAQSPHSLPFLHFPLGRGQDRKREDKSKQDSLPLAWLPESSCPLLAEGLLRLSGCAQGPSLVPFGRTRALRGLRKEAADSLSRIDAHLCDIGPL